LPKNDNKERALEGGKPKEEKKTKKKKEELTRDEIVSILALTIRVFSLSRRTSRPMRKIFCKSTANWQLTLTSNYFMFNFIANA
jgi:hypothetical protein